MANGIKYIAFDTDTKKRVHLGGGLPILDKLQWSRGDIYEVRILLYKNRDDFYTTASTVFALRIREKRTSTSDYATAISSTFIDANWLTGEGVKQIYVKDLVGGTFLKGDNIKGFTSGALGTVIDFSEETGCLTFILVSGTFADKELVKATTQAFGYTGVEARQEGTATAIYGAKASGKMSCTISINSTDLSDFMADKEFANMILELEEVDGSDVQKLLGQCEVRISNAFLVTGASALTDNDYFPTGW